MLDSSIAGRCSGRRPTARVRSESIFLSRSSFAGTLVAFRQSFFNSDASFRHASLSSLSVGETGSGDAPDHETFLIQKVLRFWQKGQCSSPQPVRISSGFPSGNSLAARGDALIHGPTLVARPVGSEWRTRHPYQVIIQTN